MMRETWKVLHLVQFSFLFQMRRCSKKIDRKMADKKAKYDLPDFLEN
jgi:hypothetical protein